MSFQPLTDDQPEPSASVQARLAPPVRVLSAGPWTARLVGDELAHISFAGRPVLRAVKAVVRDQDWRTPQPSVRSVEIKQDDNGLHTRWTVVFAGYGVDYDAVLSAVFTPATVEISFEGTAAHGFRSNRIGLVVLHPPADAGKDITVEHPDGGSTASQFPLDVSPHQPLMDIAALEWADAGTAFRLSFTGDVFETEDQRNWTDASFKTYSTPLSRPFPVDIAAGDTVRQSVLLEAATLEPQEAVEAAAVAAAGDAGGPRVVTAHIGGESGRVPALAVVAGPQPGLLPAIPGLDAIVVELVEESGGAGQSESAGSGSDRSGWAAQLDAAAAAAAAVHGAGLDIRAVTADPAGAVAELAPYLAEAKRLAVFHPASHVTEPDSWQEFKASVRAAGFGGSLLAGTRAHFTELNRDSSRTPSDADALTFSITPQMHSTEAAHIIDSVPMQRLAALNALQLAGGRPVHVGPVTLLPRFNAVATSGDDAEAEADELQDQPFTAAWMLASISALTLDGVASVSYFEASGPRGISDVDGRLNPAGELLKQLAALRDSVVLSVEAGQADADAVTLYPVQSPEGLVIFAGNLSGAAVAVDVRLPDGAGAGDGDTALGRLDLGPWSAGVVRFPAADFPAPS
ncbi:hypothetical protein [Arthrobacter sp. S39]|uniref:hypothetical protein n=1 Tax=Arthrobacter sp. S39 TaxID=2509720 RepID=UPI0010375D47|nr:hypothetical protein [Arthrobacter sp. S39]TAP45092.1 hypothetical protein EYS21_06315 [Arthrobacter sp. S39]